MIATRGGREVRAEGEYRKRCGMVRVSKEKGVRERANRQRVRQGGERSGTRRRGRYTGMAERAGRAAVAAAGNV